MAPSRATVLERLRESTPWNFETASRNTPRRMTLGDGAPQATIGVDEGVWSLTLSEGPLAAGTSLKLGRVLASSPSLAQFIAQVEALGWRW